MIGTVWKGKSASAKPCAIFPSRSQDRCSVRSVLNPRLKRSLCLERAIRVRCPMQNHWTRMRSLHDLGSLLVSRGSAMGPLLPPLALVPCFLVAAWALDGVLVILGVPVLTGCLAGFAILVTVNYLSHYGRFAKSDPDRLQSEKYRYAQARMQLIAGKGLPYPMKAEHLALGEPGANEVEPETDAAKADDGERTP